jgi:hypothetical protein
MPALGAHPELEIVEASLNYFGEAPQGAFDKCPQLKTITLKPVKEKPAPGVRASGPLTEAGVNPAPAEASAASLPGLELDLKKAVSDAMDAVVQLTGRALNGVMNKGAAAPTSASAAAASDVTKPVPKDDAKPSERWSSRLPEPEQNAAPAPEDDAKPNGRWSSRLPEPEQNDEKAKPSVDTGLDAPAVQSDASCEQETGSAKAVAPKPAGGCCLVM